MSDVFADSSQRRSKERCGGIGNSNQRIGEKMSWSNSVHRKNAKEKRREREIINDGQVFYDVYVLGAWRAMRKRGMSEDLTEAIINESMKEMFNIYDKQGDYHAMCVEETGIEVVMK